MGLISFEIVNDPSDHSLVSSLKQGKRGREGTIFKAFQVSGERRWGWARKVVERMADNGGVKARVGYIEV